MVKKGAFLFLFTLAFFVSGCSPAWREPQPSDELKAAFLVWAENQQLCQAVIAQGNPCPQPPAPISFVFQAQVSSRREGVLAGLEAFGAVASQLAPLALPALGAAALTQ